MLADGRRRPLYRGRRIPLFAVLSQYFVAKTVDICAFLENKTVRTTEAWSSGIGSTASPGVELDKLLQWEEAMRVGGGYADGYVDYRQRCQKQST